MRNYTDEDIKKAVSSSLNYKEALEKLGLRAAGGNYKTLQNNIKRLGLNTEHFIIINRNRNKIPLSDVLVKDSTYNNRRNLKKRLTKNELLKYECYECGINKWKGQKLSLQIDHINGIWNDNRIENLRLLCPNCHSLTKTFAGKNSKNKSSIKYYRKPENRELGTCKNCGKEVNKNAKRCVECSNKKRQKIKWPSINKLLEMLSESNFYALGKQLGVSDNAIRKHLRSNGVDPKIIK